MSTRRTKRIRCVLQTEEVDAQIDDIVEEAQDEKCVDESVATGEVVEHEERESVFIPTESLTKVVGMKINEQFVESEEFVSNISEESSAVTEDSLEVISTEVNSNKVKLNRETEVKEPEVVIVHATAVIEISPGEILPRLMLRTYKI